MQRQENDAKMNRVRFEDELCREILMLLGEGYRTELSQVRKNNGVLKDALYIRKENSECVPCFYVDELYRSYCGGEPIPGLAEHLADIVLNECEAVQNQAQHFFEPAWITERLFLRLVQAEANEEWLQDAVFVRILDLVAVFYVLTEDEEDGIRSFQLPASIWNLLNLGSAEEYFPKMVENTKRLFPEKIWCIEHNIRECMLYGKDAPVIRLVPPEEYVSERLYVLSNRRRINGAAVVLYPELLRRLGETFGGNYYVIPSSVHEVLLLKDTEDEDVHRLNDLVRQVNEQQVLSEEVLSNHVYYYSVEDGMLQSRTGE